MSASRLFKFSLFVRLFVIVLQVIFNQFVPDHNADAFHLPYEKELGAANWVASYLLDGFTRWDAQYFLHVALYGYTHENTLAFFPLFPILLRDSSSVLSVLLPFELSHLNCTILAGTLLNSLLASLSAVALYKLTLAVFQSEIFAFTSGLLFCFNPASIFFSALYSESLFSFFTFCGMWALESGMVIFALVSLSLSAGVRSNGVLAAGYLVYSFLKQHVNSRFTTHHITSRLNIFLSLMTSLKIIAYLLMYSLPFMAYQVYSYLLYCTSVLSEPDLPAVVVDYVTRNDLKIPSEPSKWCYWNIPFSYSYVQSRYWDVGFLQYFTLKQIPNFLLATPILFIIIVSCVKYFVRNRRELLDLGLIDYSTYNTSDVYGNQKCFPYFLHMFVASIFCSLFIHIQVVTRLLCSSSPILYWVTSMAILPSNDRAKFKLLKEHSHMNWLWGSLFFIKKIFIRSSVQGKVIFCYFLAYFFIDAEDSSANALRKWNEVHFIGLSKDIY